MKKDIIFEDLILGINQGSSWYGNEFNGKTGI